MSFSLLTVSLTYEDDVVAARQRARQIAGLLGFDQQDQTRIGTAVSEIARNAFRYARGGIVEFVIEGHTAPQLLLIRVSDKGPGIADLKQILDGRYQSQTGMGLGLIGAKRLMDQCEIRTEIGKGTTVWLKKVLSTRSPLWTATEIQRVVDQLVRQPAQSIQEELRQQNHELLQALEELKARQEELVSVNQELEDTNRGVVALYAELDEKADHLRRADQLKSRFLSNMSHEFRTPLNSILALSGLLLDRADGDLTGEQDKQVRYIRKGAESLLDLVNDLLDLAKIEAGKIDVRPVEFELANMFSALRGMLKPLLASTSVTLVFEETAQLPTLYTDEGKVSQIVRNFLSNAIKFTERGEIRVTAATGPQDGDVTISVADTGIGIKLEDQEHIFEDFTQIDGPVQRRVHGTGLGLPLCRKLALLLGGGVSVQSQIGIGSTFRLTIPIQHHRQEETYSEPTGASIIDIEHGRIPILVIDDEPQTCLLYEKFLRDTPFHLVAASNLRQADRLVQAVRPSAVILDILLGGDETWQWLARMKSDHRTSAIPILVVTTVDDQAKGMALGASAYCVKPLDRLRLQAELTRLTAGSAESNGVSKQTDMPTVLIVEDDESYRYVIKRHMAEYSCHVVEAAHGSEGMHLAHELHPKLIWLDLNMPELSGREVLERLASSPRTQNIPVVILTSQTLSADERSTLERTTRGIIRKDTLSDEVMKRALTEITPGIAMRRRASIPL